MDDEQPEIEYSKSGQPVYRHKARTDDLRPVEGRGETIDAVTAHIEKHIGPVAWVFHEILSDKIHLDLHIVEPGPDRPFYTVVTSGMSDLPMTMPPNATAPKFAELLLCLPPDWPMSQEAFQTEANYWPVRWLKTIARLPHDYKTWLGYGHTIPNGDPAEPYDSQTRLCCFLLRHPTLFAPEFQTLTGPEGHAIGLYSLMALYPEEMAFKLAKGATALEQLLDQAGVSIVLDLQRVNVCDKGQRMTRKEFN